MAGVKSMKSGRAFDFDDGLEEEEGEAIGRVPPRSRNSKSFPRAMSMWTEACRSSFLLLISVDSFAWFVAAVFLAFVLLLARLLLLLVVFSRHL